MALDVANLTATLQFQVDGVQSVLREAEAVQRQFEALGDSGVRGAQQMEVAIENLQNAVQQFNRELAAASGATDALNKYESDYTMLGITIGEAASELEKFNKLREAVKGRDVQLNTGTEEYARYITLLANESTLLKLAREESKVKAKATEDLAKAQERLNKVTNNARRVTERNAATLRQTGKETSKFRNALSGMNSMSILSGRGVATLAARMTGLGAVAYGAYQMIQKLFRFLSQGVMQATANSGFAELSDQMKEFADNANLAEGAVKRLFSQQENRFNAAGLSTEALEQALAAAEKLRGLSPNKDTMEMFSLLTSGDTRQAALGLGASAAELEAIVGSTAGLGEGARIMAVLQGSLEWVAQNPDALNEALRFDQEQLTGISDLQENLANMKEDVGEALAPAVDKFAQAIANLVESPIWDNFLTGLEIWASGAGQVIEGIADVLGLKPQTDVDFYEGAIEDLEAMLAILEETKRQADEGEFPELAAQTDSYKFVQSEIERVNALLEMNRQQLNDARQAASDLANEIPEVTNEALDMASAMREAASYTEQWISSASRGGGVASQMQALVDAYKAFEKDDSTENIIRLASGVSKFYDTIINGGAQAFGDFKLLMSGLGLEFTDEVLAAFDDLVSAAAQDVNTIGQAAANTIPGVQEAGGQFDILGITAANSSAQVNALRAALESIDGSYTTTLFVNTVMNGVASGMVPTTPVYTGATGGSESGQYGSITPTTPSYNPYTAGTGRTATSTGAENIPDMVKASADYRAQLPFLKFLEALAGAGAAGTSGGGGGRDQQLATLEEIRDFIREVNKNIVAGMNNGTIFSLSGNAVPLIEGSSLSSEGGVLINNLTLRGVWDFADPTAKREVVRQLKEALAQFEKEIA